MQVTSIADPSRMGYVGSLRKTGDEFGDAWTTPREHVERFRAILGGTIELDPFSSYAANRTVGAENFFDKKDDAFKQNWTCKTLFMNPPYGLTLCAKAIGKVVHEYERGRIGAAIVLVNNATETAWFQRLDRAAISVCYFDGRIRFLALDGKHARSNTRGQAAFLLTQEGSEVVSRFRQILHRKGIGRVRSWATQNG